MATPASSLPDRRKNYHCVQALRAVAAALVVLHHCIMMWIAWILKKPDLPHWANGAAGVDIFFAISGFVMAISLPGLAGKANKPAVFLWRRFTRVVPLYWAVTTLKVAILKAFPASAINGLGSPWRIIASYLFIPTSNGKGEIYPVVEVGWTLNFEVFFYLLFAIALALDLAPLTFLGPCLTALTLLGTLRPAGLPAFTVLSSSLVLEFLFGVILAELATRRKLPGSRAAMLLAGTGFVALMLIPEPTFDMRFLWWGVPAACVVAGGVALEDQWGARMPRWLLEAGDASYALYLTHTFIMPFLGHLLSRIHLTGIPGLIAAIVLGMGISLPLSVLVHRWVEKPLMEMFKKGKTPAAAPAFMEPAPAAAALPHQ
jgi:peptidoglycan/LPS O-acetylase OafA/YrhL